MYFFKWCRWFWVVSQCFNTVVWVGWVSGYSALMKKKSYRCSFVCGVNWLMVTVISWIVSVHSAKQYILWTFCPNCLMLFVTKEKKVLRIKMSWKPSDTHRFDCKLYFKHPAVKLCITVVVWIKAWVENQTLHDFFFFYMINLVLNSNVLHSVFFGY